MRKSHRALTFSPPRKCDSKLIGKDHFPIVFLLLFWWPQARAGSTEPPPNDRGHPRDTGSGSWRQQLRGYRVGNCWDSDRDYSRSSRSSWDCRTGNFSQHGGPAGLSESAFLPPPPPDLSQKEELAQTERIIRLAKATDISLGPK